MLSSSQARRPISTQLFEPAHPAFVARASCLDAFADPDLFLSQELVEAGVLLFLGLEPFLLALLPS